MRRLVVSYSEVKDARRCALKHKAAWIDGYRKPSSETSALGRGIIWHDILEAYYIAIKLGDSEYAAGLAVVDAIENDEVRQQMAWMLSGYHERYGTEEGWTVLATELKLIVPLPQLVDDLQIDLKVKIDLVIRDPRGDIWVDDHKSAKFIPSVEDQATDDQLPLYTYAVLKAEKFDPIGARYSYARKDKPVKKELTLDERYAKRRVPINQTQATRAAVSAYLTAMSRYHNQEFIDTFGGTVHPEYVSQSDCRWMCDFKAPCDRFRKGYGSMTEQIESDGLATWRGQPKRIEITE